METVALNLPASFKKEIKDTHTRVSSSWMEPALSHLEPALSPNRDASCKSSVDELVSSGKLINRRAPLLAQA